MLRGYSCPDNIFSSDQTVCSCSLKRCSGWDSLSDADWPKQYLKQVATLRDPHIQEPTFEEYPLDRVRMEHPNALVSIEHFPYNRCDVYVCSQCKQAVMRYTEFGGYYVDPRARRIGLSLLVV